MRTIAHVYHSYAEASRVVEALEAHGIPHSDISIVSGDKSHTGDSTGTHSGLTSGDAEQGAETGAGTGASIGTVLGGGAGLLAGIGALAIPGVGPLVAAGWLVAAITGAGVGAAAGGLLGSLTGAGISEADAKTYDEGVQAGGTLVTVRVDEGHASDVERLMGMNGSSTGMTGGTAATGTMAGTAANAPSTGTGYTAPAMAAGAATATASAMGRGDTLKVVKEDLVVGKRAVEDGGVKITSRVVETPVQEQVTLHQESVQVERRPVNQPVSGTDAFQNQTIEARAMSEEAVVGKEARVVEEIGLSKKATDTVQTVRDTVRETKVDIEDTSSTSRSASVTGGTSVPGGTRI